MFTVTDLRTDIPRALGLVEAFSATVPAGDSLLPGLRKLLAVLFDVPEASDEEAFLAAGQKFLKFLARMEDSDRRALGLGDLADFSVSLQMTPTDLSVAKQVGISPLDWKKGEQVRLTALSAESALTPADLNVCRMLGINPADFSKDK